MMNICYYMQPYLNFDQLNNPLILLLDRQGATIIDLSKSEVYNILDYEDQALYSTSKETKENEE